jgi:hypothetical protein
LTTPGKEINFHTAATSSSLASELGRIMLSELIADSFDGWLEVLSRATCTKLPGVYQTEQMFLNAFEQLLNVTKWMTPDYHTLHASCQNMSIA